MNCLECDRYVDAQFIDAIMKGSVCDSCYKHLQKKAHKAIEHAIERGKLIRPTACQGCRNMDRKIHAHHADYAKPLEVDWLCWKCHRTIHPGNTSTGYTKFRLPSFAK